MRKNIALAVSFFFIFSFSASAQFYPTQYRPDQDWHQLTTPHFKIVFPAGEEAAARKTARILEEEYPKAQQLTGGELSNFPVILTNYNDRSNGRVTTLHFRSEIDIPPIKGKTLNPETGGWLKNVVPHELVHALQFNNLGGFGLGRLVNIFSPDLARSMHGATPSGIREGLATYYESESVAPGGGRGNYPFFANQFDAVFDSPARWSMGQMVHFPDFSRPFNRHYIGGYEFTKWLQDTYGDDASPDAIDFNIRWPFLGYGIALKHATGQWPSQLYDEFEEQKEQRSSQGDSQYLSLPVEFDGAEIRRPKWLSDSTLIFYGSFYDTESGFFRYDLVNKSMQRLITTRSVGDFNYTLSGDRNTLIYSYYRPDTIYPNAFNATLVNASLQDESTKTVNLGQRLFAPSLLSDSTLIALETHHTANKLVKLNLTNCSVKPVFTDSSRQIIAAVAHPYNSDSLAVVMNDNGNQVLWLTSASSLNEDLSGLPTIAFEDGSVFDPAWHPSGDRLLFSADFSGKLQIYEYNLSSKQTTRLTEASYNAFEASYSPDGNRIAFIAQQGNRQLPVVLSRNKFLNQPVAEPSRSASSESEKQIPSPQNTWDQKSYNPGLSWLKPRTVLPTVEEISGSDRYQFGMGVHSSDLLQQQSYSLELTAGQERFWYDLSYQNKLFFPGFKARFFSEPAFRRFRFNPENGSPFIQTFLRQERSFAVSVPMSFTLNQNVDFTGLFVEPEFRYSQLRYFNRNGSDPSDFSTSIIGNIFVQFNYKLQQNIRDVQPNSGIVLYSELEHYFDSGSLTLNTFNGTAPLNFARPTALRSGIFGYVSPLKKWNQSLRIGLEGVTQTNLFFDNQSVVSDGFSEPVLPLSNNIISLNTRYTIPLVYPDNGGLLLPLYLSGIYIAGFSNTVTDPTAANLRASSRTVIGAELRLRFRISNLSVDIGAGFGFEPSRSKMHYFIGDF